MDKYNNDPQAGTADVDRRWTEHLRKLANTTKQYACPVCENRKILSKETDLWEHVRSNHENLLPPEDDGFALEKFKREFKARASNTNKKYVCLLSLPTSPVQLSCITNWMLSSVMLSRITRRTSPAMLAQRARIRSRLPIINAHFRLPIP
jgi:hypothetical protein